MKRTESSTLENKSYSKTISVKKSARDAYNAILNLRGWWSEDIEGKTDNLNETFFYHYKDIHLCKIKLIEAVAGKKVVYLITENEFNFIKDKTEWVNTKLVFDISEAAGKTKVTFTHDGLTPADECYEVCNDAWTTYIGSSLKDFIDTGKGNPNPKDKEGFNAALAKKWRIN